jgi:hypothetical protein
VQKSPVCLYFMSTDLTELNRPHGETYPELSLISWHEDKDTRLGRHSNSIGM